MVAEPSPCHNYRRFSRRQPCTKCGKDSGCTIRDDGWITCLRVESKRPSRGKLGGWLHEPEPGAEHDAPQQRPAGLRAEVADVATLDAVYSHLLSLCPLSAAHRRMLRPLGDQQVERYGTLPSDRAARRRVLDQLIDKHGFTTLRKVPGLALNDKKELDIRGAGIILPTRDVQGRIVAVDVRRDTVRDGLSRYYKLSSRSDQDEGAPSPGAPAHVARPAGGVTDTSKVYVTEGTKKADFLADRTGCAAISIPGIGNSQAALEPLKSLAAEIDPDIAIVALDQDDPEKYDGRTVEAVARAREELAQAATDLGYAVRIAQWDPADGKGVDDLLLASKSYTLQRFTTATINRDGGRIGNHTQLFCRISDIVHNHSMKAIPKAGMVAATLAVYEAERDPRQSPDGCGRYRIPLCRLADDMGVSRNLASTTIRELAGPQYQFLDLKQVKEVKEVTDSEGGEDGKTVETVTWLGLGSRHLSRWETVAKAPHLEQERERNAKRRCPHCGSQLLRPASYICGSCSHTSSAAEAKDAAEYMQVREDGRIVDSRTGAFVGPQPPEARCTVTVHRARASDEQGAPEARRTVTVHHPSGEEYDGCTVTVHQGASIDSGHLTAWLETNFVRAPSARTPAEAVRADYRRWCLTTHEEPCPWQVVESWLSESGAHLHHGDSGPVWLGVGLLADDVAVPAYHEAIPYDISNGQEHPAGDDGVVVDLVAKRAEREDAQQEPLPVDGLSTVESGAEPTRGKCYGCQVPINRPHGLCPPCRSAAYAALDMEEWR